jgi:hypothetical protein
VSVRPGEGLLGVDVAFPALHGPFGEDGTVQGMLETLAVAYVGAGVAASALCLDKVLFKELMSAAGVPQVEYVGVRAARWRAAREEVLAEVAALGLPVFVKPAHLGSSVGIVKVAAAERMAPALEQAFAHDERVIVEALAPGLEVECGVLGLPRAERGAGRVASASEPGEIVLGGEWYDFQAKYAPGGVELKLPARISAAARARARAGARRGDVRPRRLRGPRARGFLRGRRARGGERAQHDAGLHPHERVPEADGGLGDSLSGARGPPLPACARAPRGAAGLQVLSDSVHLNKVKSAIEASCMPGGSVVSHTR